MADRARVWGARRWAAARLILAWPLIGLGLGAAPALAAPLQLAPFKDRLFAYPKILESRDNGDFIKVEYLESRDIDKRDEIKVRRVKSYYVSLRPTFQQKDLALESAVGPVRYVGVGAHAGGAKAVVLYLHGQGGNRFQGFDDWSFGGNFNRIKNLMLRNGGAYLTPDFDDYGTKGVAQVRELVLAQSKRSPNAPIILSCGSMGGFLCWELVKDAKTAPHIDGLILMGSIWDDQYSTKKFMARLKRRIPIFIGHGTVDLAYKWQSMVGFYREIRANSPGYPVKIAIFENGTHGTPVRMTDWRTVLNWMFQVGAPGN